MTIVSLSKQVATKQVGVLVYKRPIKIVEYLREISFPALMYEMQEKSLPSP